MPHAPILSRSSFWLKAVVAVLLIVLADRFFLFHEPGTTLGLFALAWIAGVLIVRPGLLRDSRAGAALIAAAGFGLILADRPGPLAWLLFGLSMAVAVLSARVARGEPAWRWMQRLIIEGVVSAFGPLIDLIKLTKRRSRSRPRRSLWPVLGMLVLPVVGGAIFLALFAEANPVISETLARVRLPGLTVEIVARAWAWILILVMVWAILRPRWHGKLLRLPSLGQRALPGVSVASVTLSLIVFNALFAVQNGLDIAFLWSGAPLPDGVTLSQYAHRGANPLILTALLAGLFVLVCLRPGTETARRPLIRGLVTLWVGQTMLLVASSILRTADYVEAYGLTRFRLAAMIWMALVAAGLLLICWRMLKGRDGHWLIDANVKLLLAALAACSALDLGAVAAWWNVRHAKEVGGPAVELDLGYLHSIGSPALVSLVELERRTTDPVFRDRVASVRADILADVQRRQGARRGWIWRDARRLERVAALTGGAPLYRPAGDRDWDGSLLPPPPPPVLAPSALPPEEPVPLTSSPGV